MNKNSWQYSTVLAIIQEYEKIIIASESGDDKRIRRPKPVKGKLSNISKQSSV